MLVVLVAEQAAQAAGSGGGLMGAFREKPTFLVANLVVSAVVIAMIIERVAFQLTNILRDVKEDVERGRIYLPLEDLTQSQVAVEDVALTASGAKPAGTLKPLLRVEGERAMAYYGAAEKLLPMIDRDSRAALWVMVTIYRGLLERIIAKDYDVFTERVSVPTKEKLWILAQGALKAARYRLFA